MQVNNEGLIDGGSTTPENEAAKNVKVVERPDDAHRRTVTLALIAFLAVIIIGHYIVLVVLEWNMKKVESISTAFNTSLPVVSGLVGSAITYYFTKKE